MRLRFVVFSFYLVLPLILSAAPQAGTTAEDYSGMYSFLKDGEFVQITIEEKGAVSGFISRFGDSGSDQGSFLDQFFKSGKIEGNKVTFTTENVHGVWFTFDGNFERGPGKKPDEDGYFVVRGTLTRFSTDAEKKTVSQERQVEFKSFPRDTSPPQ
jgi:formylmethanofuran dehydrogenase subunit C